MATWMTPTTALQRMSDAITLLCSGHRPPDDMVAGWLDPDAEDERLQEFAIAHGPVWAQGIAVLDAARLMADQPTEGVQHQSLPTPKRRPTKEDDRDAEELAVRYFTECPQAALDALGLYMAAAEAIRKTPNVC